MGLYAKPSWGWSAIGWGGKAYRGGKGTNAGCTIGRTWWIVCTIGKADGDPNVPIIAGLAYILADTVVETEAWGGSGKRIDCFRALIFSAFFFLPLFDDS